MQRELRRLLLALGYFTRLPVPAWVGYAPDELNRAARYFPWVGLLIGALAGLALAAASLVLPPACAAVLALIAAVRLTGAFHEDGLADTCDGLGGGWSRDQALAIMKDSRLGSYGAVGLALVLGLRAAGLAVLAGQGAAGAALLLLAHSGSRAAALALMPVLPYVRDADASRARPVAQGVGRRELAIGLLAPLGAAGALIGLGLLTPLRAVALAALLALISWRAARYFRRRLGGYTGDCLGAVQQVAEAASYLVLIAQWKPAWSFI